MSGHNYTDNLKELKADFAEVKTDVKEIRKNQYDHEGRLSKVEGKIANGRFSRNEKFIGLGGGTGVVGLIAYAILQQLGWLPVG